MKASLPQAHLFQLDDLAAWYWWHVHRVNLILEKAERFLPSGRTVGRYLDIGCGPGSTTASIARGLASKRLLDGGPAAAVGIDADPRMEEFCGKNGIQFVRGDLESPSPGQIPEGPPFGFFTALDVLEHAEFPERVLDRLSAWVGSDAMGAVTVPTIPELYSDWDVAAGHYRRYRGSQLRGLLEGCGYRVLWQSHIYSFAFIPAWMTRKSGLRSAAPAGPLEFPSVPRWGNSLLRLICRCEQAYLRFARLPLGTSLLAMVRKER